MADTPKPARDPEQDLSSRFPTAYTILFGLIIFVAALTRIIPAGQYERVMNEEVGRDISVAGSFQEVDPNPWGFVDMMLAQPNAPCDPDIGGGADA